MCAPVAPLASELPHRATPGAAVPTSWLPTEVSSADAIGPPTFHVGGRSDRGSLAVGLGHAVGAATPLDVASARGATALGRSDRPGLAGATLGAGRLVYDCVAVVDCDQVGLAVPGHVSAKRPDRPIER